MNDDNLAEVLTLIVQYVTLRRELDRHPAYADMQYVRSKRWWSGLDSEGNRMFLDELEKLGLVEEAEAFYESKGLVGPRRSLERLGLIEAQ